MATFYSVLGLTLECNRPLPHLGPVPAAGGETLAVDLGHAPPELLAADDWQVFFESPTMDERGELELTIRRRAAGDAFHLRFCDRIEFFIDDGGRRLSACWDEPHTLEDVATYLLGPVMGFLLRLRGIISLHASAVVVDGRAVALAGPPGAGKSTTAAAFAHRRYPVLTDDITTLKPSGEDFFVQTDSPRLRLWPEAIELLSGSSEAFPRLAPTWNKRCLDLEQHGYRTAREPALLAAVYLLDGEPAQRPEIRGVRGGRGLIALIANAYANLSPDPPMRAHEFDVLSRLFARVCVRRVHRPAAGLSPAELCDLIAGDFRRLQ